MDAARRAAVARVTQVQSQATQRGALILGLDNKTDRDPEQRPQAVFCDITSLNPWAVLVKL